MWPFNLGQQMPPRRWVDMSVEFKGFFLYHLSMGALFALPITGRVLRLPEYLFVAAAVGLAVAMVSAVHRARLKWHWRGAGAKQWASVAIWTALLTFFLLSVSAKFPPPPGLMPWYLAGLGIYVFAALQMLRIVHFAEADFRADCGEAGTLPLPEVEREVPWKRVVRTLFSIFFLCVWLEGVSFFYFYTRAIDHSVREPAGEQTWAIVDHGHSYYVTKTEYDRVELLKGLMFIGIPSALAMTFFLQYVLGISMGWRFRGEKDD